MKVLIVERQKLKVVGMKVVTEPNAEVAAGLWEEFIKRMDELEAVAVPNCSLGMCKKVDNERMDYFVAKVVKNDSIIPDGMEFREIKAQNVAVFTHCGDLENLAETYQYIYDDWLPNSAFELADGYEIEWYDNRFKYNDPNSQMDIHIPIRKADSGEESVNIFDAIMKGAQDEIV